MKEQRKPTKSEYQEDSDNFIQKSTPMINNIHSMFPGKIFFIPIYIYQVPETSGDS